MALRPLIPLLALAAALGAGRAGETVRPALCAGGPGLPAIVAAEGLRPVADDGPVIDERTPAGIACDARTGAILAWYAERRGSRAVLFRRGADGAFERRELPATRGRIRAGLVEGDAAALAVEHRRSWQLLLVGPGHGRRGRSIEVPGPVAGLVLAGGGATLLVGCDDQVRSFSWPDGRTGEVFLVGGPLRALAPEPGSGHLLAVADEGGVALFDLSGKRVRGALAEVARRPLLGVEALAWAGPGQGWLVALRPAVREIVVLEPAGLREVRRVALEAPPVAAAVTEDGETALVADETGAVIALETGPPPRAPLATVPERTAVAGPVPARAPDQAPPAPAAAAPSAPPAVAAQKTAPTAAPPPSEAPPPPETPPPAPRERPPAPAEAPARPPAPPEAPPPSAAKAPPDRGRAEPEPEPGPGEIVVVLEGRAELVEVIDVRGPDNLLRAAGRVEPGPPSGGRRVARIAGLAPGRYAIVALGAGGASLAVTPARAMVSLEGKSGAKVVLRVIRRL